MVTSRPELLPRATSGSMVLPQLGSVLISMAHVITGGHKNHACSNPRAALSWHRPSLALRDLVLPLNGHCSKKTGPTLRKAGPVPSPRTWESWFLHSPDWGQSQTHIQGFELAHSNIYHICDLPECVKELVLLNHSYRISMTRATAGYQRGVLVRVWY